MEATDTRNKTVHHTARYQSSQHNVLKSTGRHVAKESIRLGNIGKNGINRYDVQPPLDQTAYGINSFYKADLKMRFGKASFPDTKKGEPPIFTLKGLQNHSSLVYGDARVQRASTQYHETYTDPALRAHLPPKHDHLQNFESVDYDGMFGQINIVTPKEDALGEAEASLKELRRSYYRETTEGIDLITVDALEREVRQKMEQKAAGKSGSYYLKTCFHFFDQDSRGAIDFDAFNHGLYKLGIDTAKAGLHLITALFARYDTRLRGFIGYYEFVDEVVGDAVMGSAESHALSSSINSVLGAVRNTKGGLEAAMDPVQEVDIHALSDEEFLQRQKLRKIFRAIDRDNNGTLEVCEFERLLVILGIRVTPYELSAIFRFIDENGNGHVSFDEFYSWYTAEPNSKVKDEERYQRTSNQTRPSSATAGSTNLTTGQRRKSRFR